MHPYTEQFNLNEFPGYLPKVPFGELEKNFWFSKSIPFVTLDLEFDLESSYQECLDNDHLFDLCAGTKLLKKKYQQTSSEWFRDPHRYQRFELTIKGEYEEHGNVIDRSSKNFAEGIDLNLATPRNDLFMDLQAQLNNFGFAVPRLWIGKLAPGGWLTPHRDFKPQNKYPTMNYFWLPLHDMPHTLKMWPYGFVKTKLGQISFFNHQYFVHSAYNPTDRDRYVAFGTIDHTKVSDDLSNRFLACAKRQWYPS